MNHELVELSKRINWKSVEKNFIVYYSATGRAAVLLRKNIGSMLLKQMYSLSDEASVARWGKILTGSTFVQRPIFYMRNHLIRVSLYIFASE